MTNPIQGTVAPVRLLGHDFSLYSGKARAYLRRLRARTPLKFEDYRIRLVR